MNRADILEESHRLVTQDREEEHGVAAREFEFAAQRMTVTLQQFGLLAEGKHIPAPVVALLMDDLKKTRACSKPGNLDNFVDQCGYTALAGELFNA